ncbi:MAG: hypothetical protein EPN47_18410 [Acidobacteria bacterium]|nr:MAG: hypothetical protein EPN47_18410 [Acidobacteriota bacterium]
MAESRRTNAVTMRDAERLVKATRRMLLGGGYPNPERVGCPRSRVLEDFARDRIDLRDAKDWILHLGCCSPCFIEYTTFRRQATRRKRLEYALAIAAMVALFVVGGWLWRTHRFPGSGGTPNVPTVAAYQPITLDLRNWIVLRGEQLPSTPAGPIQLPRGRLDLTIFLPVGSEAGEYEVQVSAKLGEAVVTATGSAVIQNGITVLKVKLDTSRLNPGNYVLGIRQPGEATNFYPLLVKK